MTIRDLLAAVEAGTLVRMQDADGRGPWRPGFSWSWSDIDRELPMPITSAMPNFRREVMKLHRDGYHIGCAARVGNLDRWFSDGEVRRLLGMDFALHNASKLKLVWENDDQALVASMLPLRLLPRIATLRALAEKEEG